ncbi:TIGR02996 domain-containing protein [Fimbriiglobus ruber]|uniref:Repeat-companion domain protein n=1 Tax=Fimbriiglobus ruber TaxID=1908690 RepID=A0A225E4L3_9BACT|nr:TIGR02996 domain-containing protein [Fimbriiglobus ruber]OWK46704.1 hypothetical protein FRUB_00403 [Fimbriiglobus ruber]
MLDREPFLRAIFANPADDLPRLVFADWLEERGEGAWADVIRTECERARAGEIEDSERKRGFVVCDTIRVHADEIANADAFRNRACSERPEWYGATRLRITGGRVASPLVIPAILASPVVERVSELDLSGTEVALVPIDSESSEIEGVLKFVDYEVKPVVTVPVVIALSQSKEVRRLTSLDLTNNNLDNDAARALAKSSHLIRLERLLFWQGNTVRGRVWSLLVERFGKDVVQ